MRIQLIYWWVVFLYRYVITRGGLKRNRYVPNGFELPHSESLKQTKTSRRPNYNDCQCSQICQTWDKHTSWEYMPFLVSNGRRNYVLCLRNIYLSRVSTLRHDIDIAIMSVSLSVRPWRFGIRRKRLNILSQFFTNPIILVLSASNIFTKFRQGHPPAGGVKVLDAHQYFCCLI